MIRKTIHYCWFGEKAIPATVKKCISSWKKFCPDYEIICWNEKNYDIDSKCAFVREAYYSKKWAFVSDYARLDVVYRYGGIYLDTDVELLAPLDDILNDGKGFFGFEDKKCISSGVGFACEKGEIILRDMMDIYENMHFDVNRQNDLKCPIINTRVLTQHGAVLDNSLQIVENRIKILPTEYLCPENIYTGSKTYTKNTIAVHHYTASWMKGREYWRNKVIILIKKVLPNNIVRHLRNLFRKKGSKEDE